jgi:hypothetical protein
MRNIKHIYLVFALLIVGLNLSAQFSSKQETEIKKKARKVLDEYSDRVNKLGKEVKKIDQTRLNIEDFLSLFVSRKTQVNNDLDPTHLLSKNYEAETYAANIPLWYPSGITIKLSYSDAQVSNVISHGDNVFSIDYIIDKRTTGLYLGKTKNDTTEKLQFRVAFTINAGEYTNFKIAGIRKPTEKSETASNKEIFEIKSAPLTENDKRDIDRETKTVLNDYANYLSLIGDTLEDIEEKISYKNSFKSLFIRDQCDVFNDILPESKKQFVPVRDYIVLYSEAYAADGGTVTFQLDSADLGIIIKKSDSLYYRQTEVNKFFNGNYLGKRKVVIDNRVSLRIVFQRSGRLFKNFKIERIDQVSKIKTETIELPVFTAMQKQKTAKKQPEIKKSKTVDAKQSAEKKSSPSAQLNSSKSKAAIAIGASGNITNLANSTLADVNVKKSGYTWNTTALFGYNVYANYIHPLTHSLSFFAGIGYSRVSTKYSVKNNDFINDSARFYIDNFGTKYIKEIYANFDSTVNINFINLPVGISLKYNLSPKIDLVIKPSININFIASANSEFDGTLEYRAFYKGQTDLFHPNVIWPDLIQTRNDWPEFGVYQKTGPKTSNIKSSLNSLQIVADLSCGIDIKLNTKTSLMLLGNFQYGLSDINKSQELVYDLFGETEQQAKTSNYGQSTGNKEYVDKNHTYTYKPTKLISYGLGVEYVWKF